MEFCGVLDKARDCMKALCSTLSSRFSSIRRLLYISSVFLYLHLKLCGPDICFDPEHLIAEISALIIATTGLAGLLMKLADLSNVHVHDLLPQGFRPLDASSALVVAFPAICFAVSFEV
jgi:hypothetical protein